MANLEQLCAECGHKLKFHISAKDGEPQQCDYELITGTIAEPDLCGCPQFCSYVADEPWIADANKVLDEFEGKSSRRCSICGEEGGGHGKGCVMSWDEETKQ